MQQNDKRQHKKEQKKDSLKTGSKKLNGPDRPAT